MLAYRPAYGNPQKLVSVADMARYSKLYAWPDPVIECFCALRDGVGRPVKLIVPRRSDSEHYKDPCLACAYWGEDGVQGCRYFGEYFKMINHLTSASCK